MAVTITRQEVASLVAVVNSHLIVRQLQAVLKGIGQPTSGLKLPLQKRLVAYIEGLYKSQNTALFAKVKELVNHPDTPQSRQVSAGYPAAPMTQPVFAGGAGGAGFPKPQIMYKESPFFTILSPLSEMARCPVRTSNRDTIKTVVMLNTAHIEQLAADKMLRCMVYCAVLDPLTPFNRETDIAFPHQVEIRVNDASVHGLNLRGLKNKPGSTRPADITDSLVKKAHYRNEVGLTYAMTNKEFGFIVQLVKTESVENLVDKLKVGNAIEKDTVISDMIKKSEDSDLVATSSVMSLKCPLSTLRIDLPVRSTFCTHIQCFDAASFLQLQQQAPTWTCPTCNKSISFKQLVVDRYFDDILKLTPKTVDSVTIDVDGKWSVAAESSNSPFPDDSDDEDCKEVVQILDGYSSARPRHSLAASTITPAPSNGRQTPTVRSNGHSSTKRPISQVIDLTLSDDEDEAPVRPAKRHAAFPTPSSTHSGNNGYHTSNRSTPNGYGSTGGGGRSPVWNHNPPPAHLDASYWS